MKNFKTFVALCLFMCISGTSKAAVKFHTVELAPSLQVSEPLSAYAALFAATRFLSRAPEKVTESFAETFSNQWMNPDYEMAGKSTLAVMNRFVAASKTIIQKTSLTQSEEWAGQAVIEKEIIPNLPSVLAWLDQGRFVVVGGLSDLTTANVTPWLEQLQKNYGAMLLNVASDKKTPRWVAIGAYKNNDAVTVCTIDPVNTAPVAFTPAVYAAITALFVTNEPAQDDPQPVQPQPAQSKKLIALPQPQSAPVAAAPATYRVGLHNNGNMCYQNATLQAINKCEPLRALLTAAYATKQNPGTSFPLTIDQFFITQAMLAQPGPDTYNPRAFCQAVQSEIVEREAIYKDVMVEVTKVKTAKKPLLQFISDWASKRKHKSKKWRAKRLPWSEHKEIQIATTTTEPRQIQTGAYNTTPLFPIGTQMDAEEFFNKLWTKMQDARVIADPALPGPQDALSVLQLQDKLHCLTCNSDRTTPDPAYYKNVLSLSIPKDVKTTCTIDELLKRYIKKERLDNDNTVECLTCAKRTAHTMEHNFFIAPTSQFLVMQLVRHAFDETTFTDSKLVTPITFPADGRITITDSHQVQHYFKVAAVVVHAGSTLRSGHYWCVAQTGIYEDSNVTITAAALPEVLTTGNSKLSSGWAGQGYLYFFERCAPPAPK